MSTYKKGDKFIIEIAEVYENDNPLNAVGKLYRIMGFKSLVFDSVGLDKLEQIECQVTIADLEVGDQFVDTADGETMMKTNKENNDGRIYCCSKAGEMFAYNPKAVVSGVNNQWTLR